jgi:carbon-monoxide dehydrogenase medium subunit
MLHPFTYHRPADLDEALSFLRENGTTSAVMAGGTDLIVNIRAGVTAPEHVVDLKGIPELHSIGYDEKNGLSVGACVTVNELIEHPDVVAHFGVLVKAGTELATHQLRNRATVVGNVVTASPCGDMTSPLLCLGAEIDLRSATGTRSMPVVEFITGVKKTQIAPDEIVERIRVPVAHADAAGGYQKLKRIKGHDLGVVAVAMIRSNGVLRTAVSSAAPTPVLLDEFPASATPDEIRAAAQKAISPIDDVRCTREYREFMVDVFIGRLMEALQEVPA